MPNRLRSFLGNRPIYFNGVGIYSPTIDEIDEIGENLYYTYLTIATFDKETILKKIFKVSDEDYADVENESSYLILTAIPSILEELKKSISFFIKEEVEYKDGNFLFTEGKFLDNSNYSEFVRLIKLQNGIGNEEKKQIKFKNNKAKEMYEKLLRLRGKHKKKESDDELTLKDMLSILCNADGNGINIFNVGQLTVYQAYEQFERLGIKEQHKRLLRVWSNDRRLGENDKLPEWLVKSKL